VIHWKDGGPTDLINLLSLCDHHHHVVHLPGWTAKFDGHTFAVFRPDGPKSRNPWVRFATPGLVRDDRSAVDPHQTWRGLASLRHAGVRQVS